MIEDDDEFVIPRTRRIHALGKPKPLWTPADYGSIKSVLGSLTIDMIRDAVKKISDATYLPTQPTIISPREYDYLKSMGYKMHVDPAVPNGQIYVANRDDIRTNYVIDASGDLHQFVPVPDTHENHKHISYLTEIQAEVRMEMDARALRYIQATYGIIDPKAALKITNII